MELWQLAYNWIALPLARAGARAFAPFKPKVSRGLAGRKKSFAEIGSYLARQPGNKAPGGGILFHASSVGEFLQALPLAEELKAVQENCPLYLSFFSPSVEERARAFRFADLAFYLPEDTRAGMQRLIRLLDPTLVVISKFDIWPNLLCAASEAGVPVAVIAATLSPDSGRLRGVSAAFHRSFYGKLSLVCAISKEDARNYTRLGVRSENCVVTGDTRFDQTFRRASKVAGDDSSVLPFRGWDGLVRLACGSIWPADEEHILPALAELAKTRQNLRFILAPHEPSAGHIGNLTSFLDSQSLSCGLYSELAGGLARDGKTGPTEVPRQTRAVIVDRVGVLAAVYRAADLVYVGGSFSTGVHNVMEPACFGLPVLFGPRYLNSYEARLMVQREGAFPVSSARELVERAERLIDDETQRRNAGEAARAVVTENLGATGRTLAALAERFPQAIPKIPAAGSQK
ncbi:MAG TPA: glycosyltransferase N-terminal domain-containing protein [archaeon]|nr:glycosyltransferase N-terminal domain-containing protein [archaeon]